MNYEQLKYRWLRSKLLEYQSRILDIENEKEPERKEEHRQVLLERLEWVWERLGELEK